MVKANPKLKATEIVQLCAQKWVDVDLATKKKLDEEFQKEKVGYLTKRTEYEKTLTPEQKESLKVVKKELIHNKERRIHKKAKKKFKMIANFFSNNKF